MQRTTKTSSAQRRPPPGSPNNAQRLAGGFSVAVKGQDEVFYNNGNNSSMTGVSVGGGGGGSNSRSCLIFPSLKKKRRKKKKGAESASTSTASSQQDKTSLIAWNTMRSMEDSRLWNLNRTERQNQPQEQRLSTPATAASTPTNLLALPTPIDRSHKKRLQYEKETRRKPVYDGELEPEGIRGEEAVVKPSGARQRAVAFNLPVRKFYPSSGPTTPPPSAISLSSDQSTTSSVDIQNMMVDFLLTETGDEQSHSVVSSLLSPPRTAALTASPSTTTSSLQHSQASSKQASLQSQKQSSLQSQKQTSVQSPKKINAQQSATKSPVSTLSTMSPKSPKSPHQTSPFRKTRSATPKSPISGGSIHGPDMRVQRNRSHDSQDNETSSRLSLKDIAASSFVAASPVRTQSPAGQSHDTKSPSPTLTNTVLPTTSELLIPHATDANAEAKISRQSAPVDLDNGRFVDADDNVDGINAMAIEHVIKGEYDMALSAFSQVVDVYKRKNKGPHPLLASAYHNLGTVHAKRASLLEEHSADQRHVREQALLCFQAAARTARDSLGPKHPNVAVSLVRIGFLLLTSRQYKHAIVTFQEALRIRISHYGQSHALVANLYNNLGVCFMHLGEFPKGRHALGLALQFQKKHLLQHMTSDDTQTYHAALLELADTLCNIGGLCLEWIRRQGPDARHTMDAEAAFTEALEIRTKVLGKKDPLVEQVQGLVEMVRSIPVPNPSPSPRRSSPTRRFFASTLSPYGLSPTDTLKYRHRRIDGSRSFEDATSPLAPNTLQQKSPARPNNTIASPTERTSNVMASQQQSPASLELPILHHKSHEMASVPLPTTTAKHAAPPEKRNYKASTDDVHQDEKKSESVVMEPLLDLATVASDNLTLSPHRSQISTTSSREGRRYNSKHHDRHKASAVYVTPHYVPKMTTDPLTNNALNNSLESELSGVSASFLTSINIHDNPNTSITNKSMGSSKLFTSYDAEENCLLAGTEENKLDQSSDLSFLWRETPGANTTPSETSSTGRRGIMVMMPYGTSNASDKAVSGDRKQSGTASRVQHSTSIAYQDKTSSWAHDAVESLMTQHRNGKNGSGTSSAALSSHSDRKACLQRAKEILEAHKTFLDSPHLSLDAANKAAYNPPTPDDDVPSGTLHGKGDDDADIVDQYHGQDDGLAPLGGSWEAKRTNTTGLTEEMKLKPEQYLQNIHDEAARQLKRHRYYDALELLQLVLDCQRKRHGPLHEDVGSALHNVGIAYLRVENNHKALQHFEEAVRVRKGALGRDHPQVAVSLVKVGITLLLLQQFEDSLWIFREALSVRKHALGSLHPSTARIYNNIGCVHVEFQELLEARRAFEAALDIQRNAMVHDPDSGPIMFATATTLCNLGYLYRLRDMHEKAVLVLREAVQLQERVLGIHHPTVLSTLDSLAEGCAGCGHASHAIKYYNEILERFHYMSKGGNTKRRRRAEAILLYKMSRVHKSQNDLEAQIEKLKLALRAARALAETAGELPSEKELRELLERHIQADIKVARESMEQAELKWV